MPQGIVGFFRENPVNPSALCRHFNWLDLPTCDYIFPALPAAQGRRWVTRHEHKVLTPPWPSHGHIAVASLDAGVCERPASVEILTELLGPLRYALSESSRRPKGSAGALPPSHPRASAYCLPTAIGIGVQKGGTSNLLAWLEMHPSVHTALFEQHFFEKKTVDRWPEYLFQPDFRLSDADMEAGVITFEKTPNYIAFPEAGRRLRALLPSVLLLLLLRDPTNRAYSAWQHHCRYRRYIVTTAVTAAVARVGHDDDAADDDAYVVQRLTPGQAAPSGGRLAICDAAVFERYLTQNQSRSRLEALPILQRGLYASQLREWTELGLFPPSQFLILWSEEYTRLPFAAMRRIEEFLGLQPFDYRSVAYQNDRGFWDLKGVPSKGDGKRYAKMTSRSRDFLEAFYENPNRELADTLRNTFNLSHLPPWLQRPQPLP